MKKTYKSIQLLSLFFISWGFCLGQRPTPVEINSLIARIPLPESSEGCYTSCTTTKDPSSGQMVFKDNGPQFNSLNDEMDKISKADMDAMKGGFANAQAPSEPAVPTADQIAQMQAEAMQRAQQAIQNGGDPAKAAQANNQPKPPSTNVALMQELGRAQSAVGQISQLTMELSTKLGQIRIADVPAGPNCPEVQQGGYAGPTCECTKEHEINYEQRRVAARDKSLQQINETLKQYIPRIKDQVALVDKVEVDSKFGQGVTDPAIKQLLWSVQRQGMGAFTSLLAMAGGAWTDGAKQYLYVVNAKAKTCP